MISRQGIRVTGFPGILRTMGDAHCTLADAGAIVRHRHAYRERRAAAKAIVMRPFMYSPGACRTEMLTDDRRMQN